LPQGSCDIRIDISKQILSLKAKKKKTSQERIKKTSQKAAPLPPGALAMGI